MSGWPMALAFWHWLLGKKSGNEVEAAYVSPPPGPRMQQLQLTAPAAVPATYGIQRAIELMRALPIDDDPALVLRVVRKTLTSTGVSLEEIISSAKTRESAIVSGIESDRAAIEQLEIQITTRRGNIARLETDLEETQAVRGRIEEAMQSETKVGGGVAGVAAEDVLRIRAEAARPSNGPPPKPRPKLPAPKLPSAVARPPAKREPISSLPDIGEIDAGFDDGSPKQKGD